MARSQLKVYHGPGDEVVPTISDKTEVRNQVTLPVEAILPLLADAVRDERTWLQDFEGDDLTISTDLYEVLLAYQHYRRPSA